MVVLDTGKTGYTLVFGREWKGDLMAHILAVDEEFTTAEAHDHVLGKGHVISRASVINFLQAQADEGWLRGHKVPGKGGMRGVFRRNMTPRKFWVAVANLALTTVMEQSGFVDLFPLPASE